MKKLKIIILITLLVMFVSSCINSSEPELYKEEDLSELIIAKKSLEYIAKSELESLTNLLAENFFERTNQKELDLLLEDGKRIINNYDYPNDSLITVSRIIVNTPAGKIVFKEFEFPFRNSNPDSTMTFKVKVCNQNIERLYLGAGIKKTY